MKTMNNFGKRSLAMFLVLVMCLGMMNLTVFAAEEHTHNEDGWTCTQGASSQGDLRCTLHVHDENCYSTEQGELTCQQEEHTHSDACYEAGEEILTCGLKDSEGHTHTDDCYEWEAKSVLSCDQEEVTGHSHGSSCYTETQVKGDLKCADESEDHEHNNDCYDWTTEKELTCPIEEGHSHNDDCYTEQRTQGSLMCELEASEGHKHSDDCKSAEQILACDKDEHTHDDGCYAPGETVKTCTEPDHTHTSDCYESVEGEWTCTPPESTEEPEPAECTCTEKCGEDGSENCAVCAEDPSACKGEEVEEPQPPAVCICDVKCAGDCTNGCEVCLNNPGDCEGTPVQTVELSFDDETKTLTISGNGTLDWSDKAISEQLPQNWKETKILEVDGVELSSVVFGQFNALTEVSLNNVTIPAGTYPFYGAGASDGMTVTVNGGTLGQYAFWSCKSLTSITLDGVTVTDNAAILYQAGSEELSVTVKNSSIGAYAFKSSDNLTSVTVENCDIGERAFLYCANLNSLTLNGVSDIAKYAFQYCGLTELDLSDLTNIGEGAFSFNTSLTSINLSDITFIDKHVAYGCTALKTVEISDCGTVGYRSFRNCPALEKVTITNVGTVGWLAFESCQVLTDVTLTNVNLVEGGAFEGCDSLAKVEIDKGTHLGYLDSGRNLIDVIPGIAERVEAILKNQFNLDPAPGIAELTPDMGWADGKVAKSDNWEDYDSGTQLVEQARWTNSVATEAEVKVDAYYTAEKQMDYIFVVDLSNSMTLLGSPSDMNARFYDMQSKLLDVSEQLLSSPGYDCRVAFVTFGEKTSETYQFSPDKDSVRGTIYSLNPYYENTNYGLGLAGAKALVKTQDVGRKTTVVFISDGQPRSTSGTVVEDLNGSVNAAAIKELGVSIYGVLQSVPADEYAGATAALKNVCSDGLFFESSNTQSFSDAVNDAITAPYTNYTVTIPVNPAFENVTALNVSTSSGEASYDSGSHTITWTITGMPFTKHTLTYRMSLTRENAERIGDQVYDVNSGNASFSLGGASVETPVLTRSVTVPVQLYTLTINYVYEDGSVAAETDIRTLAAGTDYSVPSPGIEGFVADILSVDGTMPAANVELTVVYTPAVTYTLTINYVYANGATAAETVVRVMTEGMEYSVLSPEIGGYAADLLSVDGVMPNNNVEVTVTYTTTGGTTGGGTTGGGTTGGGDTGTDNPPAPPTEEVTDPNVPLVETPEEEIPNEEVPLVETPNIPTEETLIEEKELEELLDEKVPLVDVPQTGDSSALWYAMTLLSACGLAALNPLKKRGK
ncbi:VWA domain-containing protein [Pseudoflavonifractor sp. 60]|uniref:leucine-rich repeat protein n=1 Tax=Pseudoflavonifractor sp. 60 TaxID=2304576 RepID=UPI001368F930|nr:leucine-rich repeat protein [Pseudoflavonifractor sp. 60]NBI65740.1 VWA domain-containing protein [Pseudoflavonifractor sp. 60]